MCFPTASFAWLSDFRKQTHTHTHTHIYYIHTVVTIADSCVSVMLLGTGYCSHFQSRNTRRHLKYENSKLFPLILCYRRRIFIGFRWLKCINSSYVSLLHTTPCSRPLVQCPVSNHRFCVVLICCMGKKIRRKKRKQNSIMVRSFVRSTINQYCNTADHFGVTFCGQFSFKPRVRVL